MQTTSLEVSRELEKAGFWKDQEVSYAWMDCAEYIEGCCVDPDYHITEFDLFVGEKHIPAATLDDLVPALGLDKPWAGWETVERNMDILIRIKRNGLTPDTLARVWIKLNKEKND